MRSKFKPAIDNTESDWDYGKTELLDGFEQLHPIDDTTCKVKEKKDKKDTKEKSEKTEKKEKKKRRREERNYREKTQTNIRKS